MLKFFTYMRTRTAFKLLARLKFLRGTPADPFGWTAERRMERRLIRDYERDMDEAFTRLSPGTREAVRELAELPLAIRGFGPVKAQAAEAAAARRDALMAEIRSPRARRVDRGGVRVANVAIPS